MLVTQLRHADQRIVNIIKVFIERNNWQLKLRRYSKQMLSLLMFTFAKRRIRPPNV